MTRLLCCWCQRHKQAVTDWKAITTMTCMFHFLSHEHKAHHWQRTTETHISSVTDKNNREVFGNIENSAINMYCVHGSKDAEHSGLRKQTLDALVNDCTLGWIEFAQRARPDRATNFQPPSECLHLHSGQFALAIALGLVLPY